MSEKYVGAVHVEISKSIQDGDDLYFEAKYPDGHTAWIREDEFKSSYHSIGETDGYPIYQQRVIGEKVLLDHKIKKLYEFFGGEVFRRMGTEEQELLRDQVRAMHAYALILSERIAKFE